VKEMGLNDVSWKEAFKTITLDPNKYQSVIYGDYFEQDEGIEWCKGIGILIGGHSEQTILLLLFL